MNEEELADLAQRLDAIGEQTRLLVKITVRNKVRFYLVWFFLAVWMAVTLHDEHVAHCYPPKTEHAALVCNITFPLHHHKVIKR